MIDLYQYENELYKKGINYIGGVDEVGRGPLVGPVVAACCVLPKDFKLEGLNDSKKLSEKKRNQFYDYLIKNSLAYSVGVVSPERIDEINIYEASKKAMLLALSELNIKLDLILTDYMPLTFNNLKAIPIVKGDSKARCIAAASILAKVTRDEIMDKYDKLYPEYNFKKNKGYPTKEHLEKLEKYGVIKGFYRESYKPVEKILYPEIKLF